MPNDDLRAELGAKPPPGLVAQLDERSLENLTAAIRAAKAQQRKALIRAEQDALSQLPRLVRVAIRAVLR